MKWKDIKDWEGYYQVSDDGKIRSKTRTVINNKGTKHIIKGKRRAILTTPNGYSYITLSSQEKTRRRYIHRLVAEAFLPNPYNNKVVKHINGIKTDNRAVNLTWAKAKPRSKNAFLNILGKIKDYITAVFAR